jgi:hypothetical protein
MHPKLQQPILCTTRTITAHASHQDVLFEFKPSSVYAYTLGANLLSFKNPDFTDNQPSDFQIESIPTISVNDSDKTDA